MTWHTLSPIVAPMVGYKLRRDEFRKPLPRLLAIDIVTNGCESYDADVRGMSDEGVPLFTGMPKLEVVPWAKIRFVRISSLDDDWNRTSTRVYPADVALAA